MTCVDCNVVFDLNTIKAHTNCISETDKYAGKWLAKQKEGQKAKPHKPKEPFVPPLPYALDESDGDSDIAIPQQSPISGPKLAAVTPTVISLVYANDACQKQREKLDKLAALHNGTSKKEELVERDAALATFEKKVKKEKKEKACEAMSALPVQPVHVEVASKEKKDKKEKKEKKEKKGKKDKKDAENGAVFFPSEEVDEPSKEGKEARKRKRTKGETPEPLQEADGEVTKPAKKKLHTEAEVGVDDTAPKPTVKSKKERHHDVTA
eukprot:GGOE01036201.1.p1 GENE.GGOE01036201.1~~GGOE01036201.1.p1  ORF type:complete len:308 (+),score=97.42 GGOE01036201.1:129-926(+)